MVGEVVAMAGTGSTAMVGAGTAVRLVGCETQLVALQAVTVRLLTPLVSETGQLNVPAAVAVVLQNIFPVGPVMVTILPGVAVPVIGWVSGPGWPGATVRLGAGVSVRLVQVAVLLALQAVTTTAVSVGGSVTGQLNVPEALAVVWHRVLPVGSVMVTRSPGVAVPVMGPVG